MFRRGNARDVIGQDRAKARARFDSRVPFLGRFVCIPGNVAQIIEARQLRGGGDVGDREMIAGEPAPALDEVPEIIEVVREICVPGANRQRIRLAEGSLSETSSLIQLRDPSASFQSFIQ